MTNKACAVNDCLRSVRTRGWCNMHYLRWLKTGSTGDANPKYNKSTGICTIQNCEDSVVARNLCEKHYARFRRTGDPENDHRSGGFPVGSICGHSTGYLRVKIEDGSWQFQHKIVMEESIGRALLPGENVHHKNGVRHDNRPENLELWVTYQPFGQRPEDLVQWAKEILARYDS